MRLLKSLGSLLGFQIALNQLRDCLFDNSFTICQTQFSTSLLNRVAMDIGRSSFYVEHEPEFKARVRKSRVYPAIPSFVEGLLKVRMFVAVKNAPNLSL